MLDVSLTVLACTTFEYFLHNYRVNLVEFAKLLKSYGAVNAINLDGGGSATFVVNGTVVNYPSDKW